MMDNEMLKLEYNSIKQEIYTLMQRSDNFIVAIYTVSITLLSLGYELSNKVFFVLVLIFIIPMQSLINVRRYHMARCSVYIKRYLEPCREELKWESLVSKIDSRFKEYYLKQNVLMKCSQYIVGIGTVIIALSAMFSYALQSIRISNARICCSISDILGIVLMLILFIAICYLVKGYIDYNKICESYEKILDEVEREQKNSGYESSNS